MDWKRHLITFIIVFVLIGLFMSARGGCPGRRGPVRPADAEVVTLRPAEMELPEERLAEASFTIRAELADTAQKRQQGLSGRPGLEPGYGMLYVYEEPRRPEFSWAGTGFAVTAAFLGEDGTVRELHRAEANDPEPFTPSEPARYVLEVRQGWFEDRGLGEGTRFQAIEPQEAPALFTLPAETSAA